MQKVKVKIGISYIIYVLVCLISNQFLLIVNYTLALILHELGHFYLARSKGYKVNRIKIDMLGMKLNISENIDKNDHFFIALAGPMVNFILCILCTSLWWIVPESFYFTSAFFQANLILAIFNILPVEPLDGGIMLKCLLSKSKIKTAKLISNIVNIIFIAGFTLLFIISFDKTPNFILLIFAIFFLLNLIKSRKKDEVDAYYKFLLKNNKPVSKVNLLKVSDSITLFDCFKQIRSNVFTIFYCPTLPSPYITENDIQSYLMTYDIKTPLNKISPNSPKP